jgi:hypothetical protein
MVIVLFTINILTAIPLAMAFQGVLKAGLGSSMSASELMSGLDFTLLSDFLKFHRDELSAVFGQITWVMVFYMLISAFLSGGILTGLRWNNGSTPISEFFSGCGKYFGRFFRLFLLLVVVLVVVVPILAMVLTLLSSMLTRNSTSEVTDFVVGIVQMVLFLIPMMIILMIADYAKIAVVMNDEKAMVKTAWRSTKFVFGHFFTTFCLELLMLLVPLVLFVVYMFLDLNIGMTTDLTIVVMFVIQQVFMISRAWSKVFFFGGEMSLYQSLQPVIYSTVEGAMPPTVTEPIKP